MRILVVKLASLGDLLTITPALRALRATFPDAHIGVLTTPPSAAALRGLDSFDEVLTFDKFDFDRPSDALRRLPGALAPGARTLRRGRLGHAGPAAPPDDAVRHRQIRGAEPGQRRAQARRPGQRPRTVVPDACGRRSRLRLATRSRLLARRRRRARGAPSGSAAPRAVRRTRRRRLGRRALVRARARAGGVAGTWLGRLQSRPPLVTRPIRRGRQGAARTARPDAAGAERTRSRRAGPGPAGRLGRSVRPPASRRRRPARRRSAR